jgi:geranylgeranyl reductase family protein
LQPTHDVIVVGAGPAGATLANELAHHGVNVLVLDKAVFPRSKCCGGGITVRTQRLLGPDLNGVLEDEISAVQFCSGGASIFPGASGKPIMYTVQREEFDHALVRRAQQAGARVLQGVTVTRISQDDSAVEVITEQATFRCQFLVGADGSRSVVRRSLRLPEQDHFVGLETEVSVSDKDLARWKSRVVIDVGWTPKGYGWLFPKKDHLSVGIGAVASGARNLKQAYWRFLGSLNLERYHIDRWSGGLIPMYKGKPKVVHGRVALLGDAAGLADPLTGEGIYNAVHSAHLAAGPLQKAMVSGPAELQMYQQSVDETVRPEIEASRFLHRVIFAMPAKMLHVATVDGRLWNAACAVVRGETTYSDIKGRIGTIGGLYSVLRGKSKPGTAQTP